MTGAAPVGPASGVRVLWFGVLLLSATPQVTLVVVHDDSAPNTLEVARAAAKHLFVKGQVAASIQEVPLSSTCARAAGCDARPDADVLLLVTKSSTVASNGVRLELLDERGAVSASEDIAVDDPALLAAVLTPALDRMIEKAGAARPRSTSTTDSGAGGPSSGVEASGADDWIPWVLGTLGTCGGLCAVSTIGACVYGIAQDGGGGNAGAGAGGCDIDLGLGDALGGACDGLGDGLGAGADACGSIGNIGACAAAPSMTTLATPTEEQVSVDRGAMAY